MVSGINIDTRSVTVEWFERGETKGKEVNKNPKAKVKFREIELFENVILGRVGDVAELEPGPGAPEWQCRHSQQIVQGKASTNLFQSFERLEKEAIRWKRVQQNSLHYKAENGMQTSSTTFMKCVI